MVIEMVNKGHYICDICHEYIRPKRNGKSTKEKVVNHLLKIWKDFMTGSYGTFYTKAHKECLDRLNN